MLDLHGAYKHHQQCLALQTETAESDQCLIRDLIVRSPQHAQTEQAQSTECTQRVNSRCICERGREQHAQSLVWLSAELKLNLQVQHQSATVQPDDCGADMDESQPELAAHGTRASHRPVHAAACHALPPPGLPPHGPHRPRLQSVRLSHTPKPQGCFFCPAAHIHMAPIDRRLEFPKHAVDLRDYPAYVLGIITLPHI